jgi:hypothetical protein
MDQLWGNWAAAGCLWKRGWALPSAKFSQLVIPFFGNQRRKRIRRIIASMNHRFDVSVNLSNSLRDFLLG